VTEITVPVGLYQLNHWSCACTG